MAKSRKYRKILSTPEDFEYVQRVLMWSNKIGSFAGLAYNDELAGPGGIHLELQVTEDTPEEQIQKALNEAYYERDVVSHSVRISPKEWFTPKGED